MLRVYIVKVDRVIYEVISLHISYNNKCVFQIYIWCQHMFIKDNDCHELFIDEWLNYLQNLSKVEISDLVFHFEVKQNLLKLSHTHTSTLLNKMPSCDKI